MSLRTIVDLKRFFRTKNMSTRHRVDWMIVQSFDSSFIAFVARKNFTETMSCFTGLKELTEKMNLHWWIVRVCAECVTCPFVFIKFLADLILLMFRNKSYTPQKTELRASPLPLNLHSQWRMPLNIFQSALLVRYHLSPSIYLHKTFSLCFQFALSCCFVGPIVRILLLRHLLHWKVNRMTWDVYFSASGYLVL